MSLIASDSGNGTRFEIIPEDTYTAICCEVIDLGLQRNETYDKAQPKVLIGWELPELQVEINGEPKPRIYTKQYTNSLNERATLRKDLVAWRGKQFTEEEKRALRASVPLGRFATPEEIAALVVFLCEEDSSYMTGQVLSPNGGQYMEL